MRFAVADRPTADAGGMALVRYHTLHTTAELVVFLRTLPAYLAARPAVSRRATIIAADMTC